MLMETMTLCASGCLYSCSGYAGASVYDKPMHGNNGDITA
jgi:hypothetical protein